MATKPGSPAPPGPRLTVEEFNALPIPEDPEVRCELLNGEVVVVRGRPGVPHAAVGRNLLRVLDQYLRSSGRGEVLPDQVGVVLGEDQIVIPDLLVVLKENYGIAREDGLHGTPDLLVEIVSPDTAMRDFHQKREIYSAHGVREYWIVDPQERALLQLVLEGPAYRTAGLHRGDAVFRAAILPDLEVPLAEVWPAAGTLGGPPAAVPPPA